MEPIEAEGRTVKEAVEAALSKSGLRRDQVEITVTQEGSTGFMGLGVKPAKIRLTEKRWGPDSPAPSPSAPARAPQRPPMRNSAPRPPERRAEPRSEPRRQERPPQPRPAEPRRQERAPRAPEPARPPRERAEPSRPVSAAEGAEACEKARKLVVELLQLMAVAAPTATASWDAGLERVKISVESQDAPLLVGRDGRVLESLQFLAALMLARGHGAPVAIQVDALSYWEKREQAVLDEARRAAATAKETGKPVRMEPMDSSMRRLVHRTFSADPDVATSSEGEGPWRKLVVRPKAR
ncbi:MAG: Jag N-terminal domain-containing protein [Elusimicrobia bacterium]|nr:Jag N-terminal domain-containing protein [Elusimicrobiota bacterium]